MIKIKGKAPSMVILMDLLLILVFLGLMQKKKETYEFVFYEGIPNTFVAYWHEKDGVLTWKNQDLLNEYQTYTIKHNCDHSTRQDLNLSLDDTCGIIFFGPLAEALTKVIFQSCVADSCGHLRIPISSKGVIDFLSLKTLNPALSNNIYVQRKN